MEVAENQLTSFGREHFCRLCEELAKLNYKIADADYRIQIAFQNTPNCGRIDHRLPSTAFSAEAPYGYLKPVSTAPL